LGKESVCGCEGRGDVALLGGLWERGFDAFFDGGGDDGGDDGGGGAAVIGFGGEFEGGDGEVRNGCVVCI